MPHRSDHYASALGGLGGGLGRGWMLGMQMERQKLLQKQRTLSLRQADLKVRGELTEFFKENADPALLEAQFNEVMSSLPGEDINSPRNKQFKQTLLKMNDETKSRIGKMIMRIAPDLEPGELANFTVRFMKKELTVPGLMKIVKRSEDVVEQQRLQTSIAAIPKGKGRGEGILETALGAVPRSPAAGSALARIAAQRRLMPENIREAAIAKKRALGKVETTEALRRRRLEIPLRAEEAAAKEAAVRNIFFSKVRIGPRIGHFLGVEGQYTRDSLDQIRSRRHPEGISVPTPTQIEKLQGREVAIRKANNVMGNIASKTQGRPELFGVPSFIAGTITTIARNVEGLVKLLPDALNKLPGFETARKELEKLAGGMTEVARTSAEVRSAVVDLTFQGGALAGQVGRGFSDKDFENVTRQVAAGMANDKVMLGVMRSYALLQNEAYNIEFKTLTRTTKFVGMPTDFNAVKPFADLKEEGLHGVIKDLLHKDMVRKYILEIGSRVTGPYGITSLAGIGSQAGKLPGGMGIE
jgi:hypothetical protein